MDWEYKEDAIDLVLDLKKQGVKIVAVEQASNSISLEKFDITGNMPMALILGNEVEGVQQALLNMADTCLEIPQFGTKHSLNVSVCAGVILWEFAKRYV